MESTKIPFRRSLRMRLSLRLVASCGAMVALAACSSSHRQTSYVGEDTAYYLAHARGNYAPPGPPSDPWGPYIRIAAARFDVPQMWIRQVMRVESGGHEYSNGQLIVSDAGAMGLMQLEPGTYQEMAARYGLDNDPFNPLDNILAGTAYIHEMYRIYGCPGFLAAYNAGPGRLDSYMNYRRPLPLQTINYVDMIAPNIDGYYPHHRSPADELALNTEPMGYDGGILPAGFVPDAPTPAELSSPVEVASLSPTQATYNNDAAPVTVPVSSIMPQVAQIKAAEARPVQPVHVVVQPVQTAAVVPVPVPPPAPVRVASDNSLIFSPGASVAPARAVVVSAPVRVASNSSKIYAPPPVPVPAPIVQPAPVTMARATIPAVPHPPYGSSNKIGFALVAPAMASTPADIGFNSGHHSWGIQVGAYDTSSNARAALGMAEMTGAGLLQKAEPVVTKVSTNAGTMYRARFVGLQHDEAVNACNRLSGGPTGCVILSPDEQS